MNDDFETCSDLDESEIVGVDLALIDYTLSLTPTQRLETLGRAIQMEERIAEARVRLVGHDPRVALEERFGLEYMRHVIRLHPQ
jgi:hypothetical protein